MADPRAQLNGYLNLHLPRLRPSMLEAWQAQRRALPLDVLVSAIERRTVPTPALRTMGDTLRTWWRQDMWPESARAMAAGVRSLGKATVPVRKDESVTTGNTPDRSHYEDAALAAFLVGSQELLNPIQRQALRWLEQNAREQLAYLERAQRDVLAKLLATAIRENQYAAGELAAAFRDTVTLSTTQAQGVWSRYLAQRGAGVAPHVALRNLRVDAAALQLQRAAAISGDVLSEAWNQGALESVRQGIHDGAIDPQTRKVWLTVGDENVCEVCGPLHGIDLAVDGEFAPGVKAPPMHPKCRCALAYKRRW